MWEDRPKPRLDSGSVFGSVPIPIHDYVSAEPIGLGFLLCTDSLYVWVIYRGLISLENEIFYQQQWAGAISTIADSPSPKLWNSRRIFNSSAIC